MPQLDPTLQLALALGLTLGAPVILLFKMLDHTELDARNVQSRSNAESVSRWSGRPQSYTVSTNPSLNPKRVMNGWGVFALISFAAGMYLFVR